MPNSSWAESAELSLASLTWRLRKLSMSMAAGHFLPACQIAHTHTHREGERGRESGADKNKSINYTKAMESFMPSLEQVHFRQPRSRWSSTRGWNFWLTCLKVCKSQAQKLWSTARQAGSQPVSQPARQTSCTCRSQLTEDHVSTSLRRQLPPPPCLALD